jgi:hypothetical protein
MAKRAAQLVSQYLENISSREYPSLTEEAIRGTLEELADSMGCAKREI